MPRQVQGMDSCPPKRRTSAQARFSTRTCLSKGVGDGGVEGNGGELAGQGVKPALGHPGRHQVALVQDEDQVLVLEVLADVLLEEPARVGRSEAAGSRSPVLEGAGMFTCGQNSGAACCRCVFGSSPAAGAVGVPGIKDLHHNIGGVQHLQQRKMNGSTERSAGRSSLREGRRAA